MSWTIQQAYDLGLKVLSGRYAFFPGTEWRFNNQVVLIDLNINASLQIATCG